MKKIPVNLSVSETTEKLKKLIQEKDFSIFCDIDHQQNAKSVDLEMPESRALIFGNPLGGTKLMQKDIAISLDLPLRIAIVDDNGQTVVIHQETEDYCRHYNVENHPVMEKIEMLFAALASNI